MQMLWGPCITGKKPKKRCALSLKSHSSAMIAHFYLIQETIFTLTLVCVIASKITKFRKNSLKIVNRYYEREGI